MKKIVLLLFLCVAALLLVACITVSAPVAPPHQDPAPQAAAAAAVDIPDFFLSPPVEEDQFVGLGLANLNDTNLSRRTALARARADIATQVSVSVESMLTDYAQQAGTGNDTQVVSFVEQITKEVADIELQGAVTKEQYAASDGTWYAMVYFPKDALIEDVSEVFERSEGAAFAEFQAAQALERLNAEVANNPPRSAGADSPVNRDN